MKRVITCLVFFILASILWSQSKERFVLIISAPKENSQYEIKHFGQVAQNMEKALVNYGVVSDENHVIFLDRPTADEFKEAVDRLIKFGPDIEVVWSPTNHGVGYLEEDNTPYFGITAHNNSNGEIDGYENGGLKISVVRYKIWLREADVLPLNKIAAYFLPRKAINITTPEDSAEVWLNEFDAYGKQMVPDNFFLTVGEKCGLVERHYAFLVDSDKDGIIEYIHPESEKYTARNADYRQLMQFNNPESWIINNEDVGNDIISEVFWGQNVQIDHDPARQPDHVFVIKITDGLRYACDLNNPNWDGKDYSQLEVDLLDTDGDGYFDTGDINHDGGLGGFVDYSSGMVFKDSIISDKELANIFQPFQGKLIILNNMCYGVDVADNLVLDESWDYFVKFFANQSQSQKLAKKTRQIKNKINLDIMDNIAEQKKETIIFSFAGKFESSFLGYTDDIIYYMNRLYMRRFSGDSVAYLNQTFADLFNEITIDMGEGKNCYWLEANRDGVFTQGPWLDENDPSDEAKLARETILFNNKYALGIGEQNKNVLTFSLSQNYPNPFNPKTTIEYVLPKNCKVDLRVYNLSGQEVAELVNVNQSAGNYSVEFDAFGLASGIYFYRITAGEYVATQKMTLMR